MRIRSTKPEFWRSSRIAAVSWDARLVLKGLESYVDDNGVGKDDVELIIGDLFQRDAIREPSRTLARVSEAVSHLADAGLLWRYEADGTPLLYVAFWESFQRVDKPQPGRLPRPDGTMNYKDSRILASPREGSRGVPKPTERSSGAPPSLTDARVGGTEGTPRPNGWDCPPEGATAGQSMIRDDLANIRESSRALAPGTGEQGNRGTEEQGQASGYFMHGSSPSVGRDQAVDNSGAAADQTAARAAR